MTAKVQITTFAESPYQVGLFGGNLVDNYIIEDPRYSLLCREKCETNDDADYIRLRKLIDKIRETSPDTQIWFNLDIIAHNRDFIKLGLLVDFLLENNVNTLRVADAGILNFLLREYPNIKIQLNTETGNNNYLSVQFWKNKLNEHLDRIVLSKELEYKHILDIIDKTTVNTEIQIHGNILLLYTKRRVLKSLDKFSGLGDTIYTEITESKRPNEQFPLIDNPHGSFMLNSKLICLLEELPSIIESGISSLLIDLRGYSTDIIYDTLMIYQQGVHNYYRNEFDFKSLVHNLPQIQNTSYFKGFLLENKTDRQTKKTISYNFDKVKSTNDYVGTVIDTIKEKAVTIKFEKSVPLNESLIADTPEGKLIPFRINHITDLNGDRVKNIVAKNIYIAKWKKGIVKKSNIYLDR